MDRDRQGNGMQFVQETRNNKRKSSNRRNRNSQGRAIHVSTSEEGDCTNYSVV